EEISTLPASTQTSTMKLFRKAWPMSAFCQAITKLSKLSQLSGSVMTLVEEYSSSVLKAVMTQDTMGTRATKAANTSNTYLAMLISRRFALMAAISLDICKGLLSVHFGRAGAGRRSGGVGIGMDQCLGGTAVPLVEPAFHSLLGISHDHDQDQQHNSHGRGKANLLVGMGQLVHNDEVGGGTE